MLLSLVLIVPCLLLAAAGILMIGGETPRFTRAKAAAYPIGLSFLGAIGALALVTSQGPITVRFYNPASAASFIIPIGFYVDRLSAVMMTLITGVSTIIYCYSTTYMYQDRHARRYLTLICLTDFVLICMVSSGNLMMLFLFWQILSYLLYLLAHNHIHPSTLAGAFKTFTLLRVADTAFLAGIVLAYQLYGTLEFHELFARAAATPMTLSILPGMDVSATTAVTFLLFIGAMGKSAQFPLHLWLPGSLFAPTPVHALLHAGIINAGGFLINRLAPLFGMSSTTLHIAFLVGTLTAVLGATMMLVQNDIKKTLGFSTIGQMGYMIMECGLGAFSLAVFHLIAHGLFKATVFLNCSSVIHKARQEPHFPRTDAENDDVGFSRLAWSTGFVDHALHSFPDSARHARGPTHSIVGIPGNRHYPFFHLDYLLASDLDAHTTSRGGFVESIDHHVTDTPLHRVRLPVCRGVVHRFPLPQSGRSCVLFQSRRSSRLAF